MFVEAGFDFLDSLMLLYIMLLYICYIRVVGYFSLVLPLLCELVLLIKILGFGLIASFAS